jgi:hypothetical protein
MKTLLTTAALIVFAFAGSANAAEMKMACDDASFAMVMKAVDGAKGDAKVMGMKELDMAKMAMKEKKNDDCMMHLDMADKEAMKK